MNCRSHLDEFDCHRLLEAQVQVADDEAKSAAADGPHQLEARVAAEGVLRGLTRCHSCRAAGRGTGGWAGAFILEVWVAEQREAAAGLHLHLHLQASCVRDGLHLRGHLRLLCRDGRLRRTAPVGTWWLHLLPRRQQQLQRAASQARPRRAAGAVWQLQQTSTCKQAVATPPARAATAAAEGGSPGRAKVAETLLSCNR